MAFDFHGFGAAERRGRRSPRDASDPAVPVVALVFPVAAAGRRRCRRSRRPARCGAGTSAACSPAAARCAPAAARRSPPAAACHSAPRRGWSARGTRRRGRCSRSTCVARRPRPSGRGNGTRRNFACGFGCASSSTCDSRTPFHWPMQLQPSTQSCRVICVRAGIARSSRQRELERAARPGRRPSGASPRSRPATIAAYSSPRGMRRAVGAKHRRDVGGRELLRHRAAARARGARVRSALRRCAAPATAVSLCAERIAAGERAARGAGQRRRAAVLRRSRRCSKKGLACSFRHASSSR